MQSSLRIHLRTFIVPIICKSFIHDDNDDDELFLWYG